MKKMVWLAVLVFMFAFVGVTCLPVQAQEKTISLNFANFFPPDHAITLLMTQWGKDVEKKTNGKVKVTMFPGGILTPAAQTYASVIKGVADVGLSFNAYTKGRFPLSDILTLPLGVKDGYQGCMLANAFYKKFKPKEFDQVKVVFMQNSPPQIMGSTKPITKLEDLKGVKMRAGGGVEAAFIQALGGVPVALPMPDVYDALQKGVINAFCGSYEALKAWKLAEVLTSVTDFDMQPNGAGYVVMNREKWNAIPPDMQKAIDATNDEYAEKIAKLWVQIADGGKQFFLQKGGKIVPLSKEENSRWKEKVRPVVDTYVKELKSKNLPGDEALKFCYDYVKAHP